jgi:hypothetical protein
MRSMILLLLPAMSVCGRADAVVTTWTGWFSDEACARARGNSGVYTATNPDCARKCIEKGSAVVFIAEQEGAIYTVKNYAGAKDDIGYKIEVTGTLDEEARSLTVKSVKRLQPVSASCSRAATRAKVGPPSSIH